MLLTFFTAALYDIDLGKCLAVPVLMPLDPFGSDKSVVLNNGYELKEYAKIPSVICAAGKMCAKIVVSDASCVAVLLHPYWHLLT